MKKKRDGMVSQSSSIRRAFNLFLARLDESIQPEKVILFGSRSGYDYTEGSDFDLIVVSKKFKGVPWVKRAPMVIRLWDMPLDLEVICLTPKEFERRSDELSIVGEAVKSGVEVHS